MSMRKRHSNTGLAVLAIILAAVLLVLILAAVYITNDTQTPTPTDPIKQTTTEPTTEPTTVPPTTQTPVVKESSATISAVGDMLMHKPVINTGHISGDTYDFASFFTYFSDYCLSADYMVANLETTLAGTDNGYSYSGYPRFNCPDDIISSLKSAGFDMILTANNHSYDTGSIGLKRTQEVIAQEGLQNLGTKPDADAPNYVVVELNGIRVGMVCYTYETDGTADQKSLNGLPMKSADIPLINSFDEQHLDLFYSEMEENLALMEADGADAVIAFLHWGLEEQLNHNATQSAIAQKLCDLGVDVIIGGHPHVVQPVELLTSSTDDSHKTVCLYSMGNAVSNQRREEAGIMNSGHTEDGVMFSVTFSKYSDGTVILDDVHLLPFWVNKHRTTGATEYNILPLDKQIEGWQSQFGLTDTAYSRVLESYDRTMAIVGDGMADVEQWLTSYVAETEDAIGVR